MSNIFIENADFKNTRNPSLSPLLSLFPGLGQLYNGQARKGLLFIAIAVSYLFVFLLIGFNQSIIDGLSNFGQSVHMKPDSHLVSALYELRLGSALSFIVFALYISFVIYAMRDAQDQTTLLQRRLIYADCALEMNEATSSSYLLHIVSISLLFVLAVFFFKHAPAPIQITNIEFVQSQLPTKRVVVSKYRSATKSQASGTHKPLPVLPASTAKGVKNVPKVLRESSNNNSALPQFKPRLIHSATTLPTPPQLRATTNPVVPVQHNIEKQSSAIAPAMPKVSNSQTDLPKPISADRSKSVNSFLQPSLNKNSASNSKNLITGIPGPISAVSGSQFVPIPSSSGPSSDRSSGSTPSNLVPSKANTMAGIPGIRGPVVRPVLPAFGDPSGAKTDNTVGNTIETATHNGPISVPTLPVDFGAYMGDLQRRIKRSWFPPKAYESKKVEVIFKIHKGGELSDLRILKSCGFASADEAALRAVQNAAPFRSLPQGAPENIDIQFTFDYSVFSGKGNLFKSL